MGVAGSVWESLQEGFFMFWNTLWALVLGFTLSGAVQAFVSRAEMRRALGDHAPRTVLRASLLGAASSSCSYAASALAKSLFARGADFTATMVFMFASTNLVVELGLVLWLLIGWQFALAEYAGGALMIGLLAVVMPRTVNPRLLDWARRRLEHGEAQPAPGTDLQRRPWRQRLRDPAGWANAAGYAVSDATMLRRELFVGYLVAGFLAEVVPTGVWHSLFLTGHGFLSSLENALIGPFLAFISFVCSVGNIPLAAALWTGGISFGGVVAFIFADLITIPLFATYRKFYGGRLALRLLAVFWTVMSAAGLAVEYLFHGLGIVPTTRPEVVVRTGFAPNYTLVLNVVALGTWAVVWWLHRHQDRYGGAGHVTEGGRHAA